jgi:SPP1 family predicted phage head-tail adaptor
MKAGRLREQVTLQQEGTRTDDGFGGGGISHPDVATLHAAIVPLSGTELFEARQFTPSVSHRVEIRYYAGIKASWQVVYGARKFNIKSIIDIEERHREMHLMCEELPAP